MQADFGRDRLLLNGEEVAVVGPDGSLITDLSDRINSIHQVQQILQNDVTRSQMFGVADAVQKEDPEAAEEDVVRCLRFLLEIDVYSTIEEAGGKWQHRFLNKYHHDAEGRLFVQLLSGGHELPFHLFAPTIQQVSQACALLSADS